MAGLGRYPCSRLKYNCDFSIVSSHWSCVLVSMCVGNFGVAGLGWYLCSRLKHNSNTHRNKSTRPMW